MKKLIVPIAMLALMGQGCFTSAPAPRMPPTIPANAPRVPPIAPPPAPTPTPVPTPESSDQNMPPQNTVQNTLTVNIQNFAFTPATITVKKGDKIIFVNHDTAPHTVTSDGKGFDSGNIASGQGWTLETTQLATGSYAYHCAVHPMMKGNLIVK